MSNELMIKFADLYSIQEDRREYHLYMKFDHDQTILRITSMAYGYKSFVSLGRTIEFGKFEGMLFRRKFTNDQYLQIKDIKDMRIRDIELEENRELEVLVNKGNNITDDGFEFANFIESQNTLDKGCRLIA